jgi:hypothetical protein
MFIGWDIPLLPAGGRYMRRARDRVSCGKSGGGSPTGGRGPGFSIPTSRPRRSIPHNPPRRSSARRGDCAACAISRIVRSSRPGVFRWCSGLHHAVADELRSFLARGSSKTHVSDSHELQVGWNRRYCRACDRCCHSELDDGSNSPAPCGVSRADRFIGPFAQRILPPERLDSTASALCKNARCRQVVHRCPLPLRTRPRTPRYSSRVIGPVT